MKNAIESMKFTNVTAYIQDIFVFEPRWFEVLQPQILDVSRISVAIILIVVSILKFLTFGGLKQGINESWILKQTQVLQSD